MNDRPWMTSQLKRLIIQRQKAFATDNKCLFKLLRNKVNRDRKHCRKIYYRNKVSALKGTKPYKWWREIKQLCGASENNRPDFRSNLSMNLNCGYYDLANKINEAFIGVMSDFEPLTEEVCVMENAEDEPIQVTSDIVVKKLRQLSTTKANGPDNLPNWLLKTYADIIAPVVTDILNCSFQACKVPKAWKMADVPPIPKHSKITDFNKDLRPISLTSTLSKVAEGFIIDKELKPVLLKSLDPQQYGFIPKSCTTFALISMLNKWLTETDYKKAFDVIDHKLLIAKLLSYGIRSTVINWITDFLRYRLQRVKISTEGVSDFLHVPAGVPQGTRIGPWLFLAMINDLSIEESPSKNMWKFADDNTISEVILKDEESTLQETMNQVADWSKENKFQLNPKKCKELRINFTKQSHCYEPVRINDQCLELVKSARILGMLITDDLKWNCHIENIVSKASKRLYM